MFLSFTLLCSASAPLWAAAGRDSGEGRGGEGRHQAVPLPQAVHAVIRGRTDGRLKLSECHLRIRQVPPCSVCLSLPLCLCLCHSVLNWLSDFLKVGFSQTGGSLVLFFF